MIKSFLIYIFTLALALLGALGYPKAHAFDVHLLENDVPVITSPVDYHLVDGVELEALPVPVVQYTPADLKCLADNIYFEARGEGDKGMLAVAYVTVNRTMSEFFPGTICQVVQSKYKKTCQFSWFCNKSLKVVSKDLYEKSLEVAKNVLYGYHPEKDPTAGALFFHSKDVNPRWNKTYIRTIRIKNHLFYRPRSKSRL